MLILNLFALVIIELFNNFIIMIVQLIHCLVALTNFLILKGSLLILSIITELIIFDHNLG